MSEQNFKHLPVLLAATIDGLNIKDNGLYLDGTLGGGGHSLAILQAAANIDLIGIDQDQEALAAAKLHLAAYQKQIHLYHGNFADMAQAVASFNYPPASLDGILLDIGVSSYQLDNAARGFSYMQDAPLDMRMDASRNLTAYQVVNQYSAAKLTDIFYQYGEEKWAKRIALFIEEARMIEPILSTSQLVSIIKKAVPQGAREKDQHPAKRVFQALRIEVNDELGVLDKALDQALSLLKVGGRLAIISFHSLEDRIVKDKYKLWAAGCICDKNLPICQCKHQPEIKIINRKPIIATAEELEQNPRSRSAKLRIAEKII